MFAFQQWNGNKLKHYREALGEGSAADTGVCLSNKCVDVLSQRLCRRAEENSKKPQNNQSPGFDLNPGPTKHEAALLTTTL
jgi:hypothetical protein